MALKIDIGCPHVDGEVVLGPDPVRRAGQHIDCSIEQIRAAMGRLGMSRH